MDNAPVELVAIEATATLVDDGRGATRLATPARRRGGATAARLAYFGPATGAIETPVVDRADLGEAPRAGPLIVEEYEGTSVVPPGASAALDAAGNIVIEVGP
jgi:N-methylhydantoinase A